MSARELVLTNALVGSNLRTGYHSAQSLARNRTFAEVPETFVLAGVFEIGVLDIRAGAVVGQQQDFVPALRQPRALQQTRHITEQSRLQWKADWSSADRVLAILSLQTQCNLFRWCLAAVCRFWTAPQRRQSRYRSWMVRLRARQ